MVLRCLIPSHVLAVTEADVQSCHFPEVRGLNLAVRHVLHSLLGLFRCGDACGEAAQAF